MDGERQDYIGTNRKYMLPSIANYTKCVTAWAWLLPLKIGHFYDHALANLVSSFVIELAKSIGVL